LQVDSNILVENEDKARAFLDTFFPEMDQPHEDPPVETPLELPWPPITELEVHRCLKAAKSSTAPGEDGLPTLVWKHLWKYLGKLITRIFTASVDLGHHPKRWRGAKIMVLRKPGKPDYSVPGAYRPISLLNTLGKLLEAVIARRLSYLAEKHGLLPDTQFGGRPGRTTEQALLVLSNAIDQAWYKLGVVTLIAFDQKGAFNGVNKISLDARLRAKGIPAIARKWITSFMSDRFASIGFDDFRTEVALLANAGLAQGSPLSPILFTFFNSDLVDQPVTFRGGASAFIDDYFRWRVGRSAEENLAKIQTEDIPRIEAWARRTGSCFAAEKTELIHLTRKRSEQLQGQVVINGKTVKPSSTAKLLGVIFDHELRWKEHVQQAIKRATRVTIALSGLRHLRPEQMRQIYQACVTPVVDYSSTVWHDPLRDKTHLRHLNTVQRAPLIRILSAFRTVATTTLEVEAHVLPTHLRLRRRAQHTIARLHTLPRKHPIWSALLRAQRRRNNIGNYARFPLAEALKTMDLQRLDELETIDPSPLPPWRAETFTEIEVGSDRESAIERAETARSISDIVVYSDASGREGHLGAAVVALDDNLQVIESQQVQVGPVDRWSVHVAELIGIFYAISMVFKIAYQRPSLDSRQKTATILCDSRSALQATQNPRNKSGQRIVHAILQAATEIQVEGIALRLQWVPGHCNNSGNDAADRLAKDAACPGKNHPFRPLLSRESARLRINILNQWEHEWRSSSKGGHLRKIDGTLPATYTRRLYGSLPRNRAYLLTQLRTGHNWLSTYAKSFGFRDDDQCVCGAQETVTHVLVDCPELRDIRRELRSEVGDAFRSVSSLLGGSAEGKKGKPDTVSRAKTVKAVLDFAEASQRFWSRAPRGQPNNGNGN
jgi:ribonuclease HI